MEIKPEARLRYCTDAPFTWRRPGVVAFGDDPPIIVEHVSAQDLMWLTALTGMRTGTDLAAEGTSPTQHRLLEAAIQGGAIEDLTQASDTWRLLPIEQRARLSGDLAAYRHAYRSSLQAHAAMEARLQLRVEVQGDGPLRDALLEILQHCDVNVHTSNPDVVLLSSLRHPDALPMDLMYDHGLIRSPHLPVHVFGNRGVVGPLVIPEVTACTTCWHLRQRDRDPSWALRAAQFSGFKPAIWPLDRPLMYAVIAQAILLLHTWCANPDASHLWANQIRTLWLPDGSMDTEELVKHPECGCARSPLSGSEQQA